jgi:hypothetical protein
MCIVLSRDYLLFGYCYCYSNMQVLIMVVIDFFRRLVIFDTLT